MPNRIALSTTVPSADVTCFYVHMLSEPGRQAGLNIKDGIGHLRAYSALSWRKRARPDFKTSAFVVASEIAASNRDF